MKNKPVVTLYLLAVLYGFSSRVVGDILQVTMFQAPLVVLPLVVMACLAFNFFYSLRPVESGIQTAAWLVTLYLGYLLAGLVHNLLVPTLPYSMDGMVFLAIGALALVGFGIGVATPLLFVQKRRSRLSNRI